MNGLFTENSCYVEHEVLLRQLHHLIAEGLGDTEEADAVRDRMEPSWYRLKPEEKKRIEGLSADLYMLQDDEVFEPSDGRTKIQIGQAVYAAIEQERWEEALKLMRQPNLLPRVKVAVWRARAYDALGEFEAALLFLRYAVKLDPEHPGFKAIELSLLVENNCEAEARHIAALYLNDSTAPALLRINAAGILALPSQSIKDFDYVSIVPALKQAVQAESPTASLYNEVMAYAYEILAYCYFRLGDIQLGYNAVTEGMRLGSSEPLTIMKTIFEQMLAGDTSASTRYEQLMSRELQALRRSPSADRYALAAA